MPHHTSLIATMAAGLVLAFVFGMLASRFRLSPLVGYLLAGVVIGPFTPGYVADLELAPQLAEIGVILLMFGVGLHFSLDDLMKVRRIAVPGAIVQIGIATLLGWGLASLLGWDLGAGLVFGLALSVASTVVLLRALERLDLFKTERGRIAIGWLIVEDLAMVLALVLLPPVARMLSGDAADAGGDGLWLPLAMTLGKVAVFVTLMLAGGRRLIPWLLARIARTGSRELFTLGVLAIALGIAYGSAALFSVSFALGAFFAGMVLSESDLSHRAAEEMLPLKDAFAVLFFVSVGMLFDPGVLLRSPWSVAAVVAIIILGKSAAALGLVLAMRYPLRTALTVSVSLAQIGEFSFILAGLGIGLGILPQEGQDLILAGALLSITANPFLFALSERLEKRLGAELAEAAAPEYADEPVYDLQGHAIVIGHGRVGRQVVEALSHNGPPIVAVDLQRERTNGLRSRGINAVYGNATVPGVLERAGVEGADLLLVAIPDGFEAGTIVERARQLNPGIRVIARAHSEDAITHLENHGADAVYMGEREVARRMIEHATREAQPFTGLSLPMDEPEARPA